MDRRAIRRGPIMVAVLGLMVSATIGAEQAPLKYPPAAKGAVVDDYFGTKVADPYRWMEDLNAPQVKAWIDAENAVIFGYLGGLSGRDALKSRITEPCIYPRALETTS